MKSTPTLSPSYGLISAVLTSTSRSSKPWRVLTVISFTINAASRIDRADIAGDTQSMTSSLNGQGQRAPHHLFEREMQLSAGLDRPSILATSTSYSPYWICKVDGVEKDIFPAYHTFMGVFLEEGQNLVQLEYCPPYCPCR